jgi:hypothetical protein
MRASLIRLVSLLHVRREERERRHVLDALDAATATAVENGDVRLELGHIRLGIEDWRDRLARAERH